MTRETVTIDKELFEDTLAWLEGEHGKPDANYAIIWAATLRMSEINNRPSGNPPVKYWVLYRTWGDLRDTDDEYETVDLMATFDTAEDARQAWYVAYKKSERWHMSDKGVDISDDSESSGTSGKARVWYHNPNKYEDYEYRPVYKDRETTYEAHGHQVLR